MESGVHLVLLLALSRLLFLLLRLPQRSTQEILQFFIFQLLLRLDEARLVPHWGMADQSRSVGQDGDGEMESCDIGTGRSVSDNC